MLCDECDTLLVTLYFKNVNVFEKIRIVITIINMSIVTDIDNCCIDAGSPTLNISFRISLLNEKSLNLNDTYVSFRKNNELLFFRQSLI